MSKQLNPEISGEERQTSGRGASDKTKINLAIILKRNESPTVGSEPEKGDRYGA